MLIACLDHRLCVCRIRSPLFIKNPQHRWRFFWKVTRRSRRFAAWPGCKNGIHPGQHSRLSRVKSLSASRSSSGLPWIHTSRISLIRQTLGLAKPGCACTDYSRPSSGSDSSTIAESWRDRITHWRPPFCLLRGRKMADSTLTRVNRPETNGYRLSCRV